MDYPPGEPVVIPWHQKWWTPLLIPGIIYPSAVIYGFLGSNADTTTSRSPSGDVIVGLIIAVLTLGWPAWSAGRRYERQKSN